MPGKTFLRNGLLCMEWDSSHLPCRVTLRTASTALCMGGSGWVLTGFAVLCVNRCRPASTRVRDGRRQRRSRLGQRCFWISHFRSQSKRGVDERHAAAQRPFRVRLRWRSGGSRGPRLPGPVAGDDRLLAAVFAAAGRYGRARAVPDGRVSASTLAGRRALWIAVLNRSTVTWRTGVRTLRLRCSGGHRRQRLFVEAAGWSTYVRHLRGRGVRQTLRRL